MYRRVRQVPRLRAVLVATDDERIRAAVEAFGGTAVMTSAAHPSGTDRLAEVAAFLRDDVIVNVQGDEPLIAPDAIAAALGRVLDDPSEEMATLARPIEDVETFADPHVVKVVAGADGRALYFSRAPVPWTRVAADGFTPGLPLQHIGLYVYRRDVLLRLAALPPSPLERSESLEQLRALEHGIRISVVATPHESIGVDTPEDLERIRRAFPVLQPS